MKTSLNLARLVLYGSLLSYMVGASQAATFIEVGNHLLLPNTPNQVIEIYVTGGDQVEGVRFNAQIGDNPEVLNTPIFHYGGGPGDSTIDAPGTIFEGQVMNDLTFFPSFFQAEPAIPNGYVTADGLLAILVIDTTGFFSGTWALNLANTYAGYQTDWAGSIFNGQQVPDPIITDGSITIGIPEPDSVALAAAGALTLMLACWSRRRSVLPHRQTAKTETSGA